MVNQSRIKAFQNKVGEEAVDAETSREDYDFINVVMSFCVMCCFINVQVLLIVPEHAKT